MKKNEKLFEKLPKILFWKWKWRIFDILILKFWQIFVKKPLKTAEKPKIGAAHNIILAKCGLEFYVELIKFAFAAAFHIVFFHNLVNLKKHRLRLGILELKFFEFPALRQYFFVARNTAKNSHWIKSLFLTLKETESRPKIVKKIGLNSFPMKKRTEKILTINSTKYLTILH